MGGRYYADFISNISFLSSQSYVGRGNENCYIYCCPLSEPCGAFVTGRSSKACFQEMNITVTTFCIKY
jgi:hypothetical protein